MKGIGEVESDLPSHPCSTTTTMNSDEVAAIQKDWVNREFVEVVKLNMLQVRNGYA